MNAMGGRVLDVFLKKMMVFSYLIVVFFMAFDGLRNALLFSGIFSYVREFFVFLVFFVTSFAILQKRLIKVRFLASLPFLFLFFVFLVGVPSSIVPYYPHFGSVSNPVVMSYRQMQFFMLILSFYYVEEITGKDHFFYFKWLVFFLSIYTIITPYLFIFRPFFMDDSWVRWWGRIGVGYPTMDAQTYIIGIILLFYCLSTKIGKYTFNLLLILLFLGVLLQVTGTGFISLLFIMVYFLFYYPRASGFVKVYPSVLLLIFVCFMLFISSSELGLESIFQLVEIKFYALIGGDNVSVDIREKQLQDILIYFNKDIFIRFLGLGNNIYVENQYSFFLLGFGYFGFFVFLFFIFYFLVVSFVKRRRDSHVLFLSTVIFSLSSYTLVSFYLFPIFSVYALVFSYSLKKYWSTERCSNV